MQYNAIQCNKVSVKVSDLLFFFLHVKHVRKHTFECNCFVIDHSALITLSFQDRGDDVQQECSLGGLVFALNVI